MILEIKNITEVKTAFDFTIEPSDISLDEESASLSNSLEFAGHCSREKDKIRVEGNLVADLLLDCDRCLMPQKFPLKIAVNAIFLDPNFLADDTERQLNDDDLIVSLIESETLDFPEIAREQILLALPTHFVCSESCKGLCEMCKTNKNINDCDCNQKETDPRWAGLRNLIK